MSAVQTTAPLKPVLALGFVSRLQVFIASCYYIELCPVTMYFKVKQRMPLDLKLHLLLAPPVDGKYQWILHCIDYLSNFNFAYLSLKTCKMCSRMPR